MTFEVDVSLHDQWVSLGARAARTKKRRLGKLVTPLARCRPHIIPEATFTLDHLSKGRVRESAFSWIKRGFREYVTAKNLESIVMVCKGRHGTDGIIKV